MSQLQHTPGPWFYGANECADNDAALAICKENIDAHTGQSSGHFFVVYVPDGRRTALVGHGPDGEANARLIAAAPILLRTLQHIADVALANELRDFPGIYRDAMYAIAEATGKSK